MATLGNAVVDNTQTSESRRRLAYVSYACGSTTKIPPGLSDL